MSRETWPPHANSQFPGAFPLPKPNGLSMKGRVTICVHARCNTQPAANKHESANRILNRGPSVNTRFEHTTARWILATLLTTHVLLVGYQGLRNAPNVDEIAHLPSGLSHWTFGNFDLYRVNPPLIRMLASVPLLLCQPETDWNVISATNDAYDRPEFRAGRQFLKANQGDSFWYFTVARWMLIPVSVMGALVCYAWATDLFGAKSGLMACAMWCFCPNVLSWSATITPDAGATAFGVLAAWLFWRWLRDPNWTAALAAGVGLGLAELTKSSWVVLFGLWPGMWVLWRLSRPRQTEGPRPVTNIHCSAMAPLRQLIVILLLGLYLLNLGYAFEGTGRRLGELSFVSKTLGGEQAHETPGNRFADSWLNTVPIPVPTNYLLGMDVQKYDFERGKWSFLRGEHREGGWWYYYLYAILIKTPIGFLAMIGMGLLLPRSGSAKTSFHQHDKAADVIRMPADSHQPANVRPDFPRSQTETNPLQLTTSTASIQAGGHTTTGCTWRDELVLVAPAIVLLCLVSSQTGFNRYLRYALPVYPFLYILASRVALTLTNGPRRMAVLTMLLLAGGICSSLSVFPYSQSYFNAAAGGPDGGRYHLLDANIDWGQDVLRLADWAKQHPDARPLYAELSTSIDFETLGLDAQHMSLLWAPPHNRDHLQPPPGWYAISVNDLMGYRRYGRDKPLCVTFQNRTPVDRIGYSIFLYRVD